MFAYARRTSRLAFLLFALAAGATFLAVRPQTVFAAGGKTVWVGNDCAGVCYNGPMVCCAAEE